MSDRQPVFYYDLAGPECYIAAELIAAAALPEIPEWEPVLGSELGLRGAEHERERIERLALEHQLQPVRWPPRTPDGAREAMLAATYAKHIGRVVGFSLAAFRQAFAGGRSLADRDTVLIAAAACEMHPAAVLKALELRSVATSLQRAGERAVAAGVRSLPAIEVNGRLFSGEHALRDAATALVGRA